LVEQGRMPPQLGARRLRDAIGRRRRELGAAGRELVARRYGHRQSAELLLAAIADRQAATGRVSRR
jgi:hypothetical protein